MNLVNRVVTPMIKSNSSHIIFSKLASDHTASLYGGLIVTIPGLSSAAAITGKKRAFMAFADGLGDRVLACVCRRGCARGSCSASSRPRQLFVLHRP